MDFVNSITGAVKELQRTADIAFAVSLFYSKAISPCFRENTQINLFAENDRSMRANGNLFIRSDFFMHNALIAGQCHYFAECFCAIQNGSNINIQTDSCGADMRSNIVSLSDTVGLSKVPLTGFRIFTAQAKNILRCQSPGNRVRCSHYYTPIPTAPLGAIY